MAEPLEKAKDLAHAVEHPVETAKALEHEAAEGGAPERRRSPSRASR